MHLLRRLVLCTSVLLLSSCMTKGPNPNDPYERVNRNTYKFNQFFDSLLLKPAAQVYKAVIPAPIRTAINNGYDNVNMIPTTANDVLQGDLKHAVKDFWRLFINSTLGVGGLLDVAANRCGLPPRSNDLGLTFAKWGDKKSPYLVIPFLGPSTFRDGMGLMFDYALFTPYPYIKSDAVLYGILGLRYIDLRSQMFDADKLMADAIDKYAFMRDAYLQHRQYLMTGEQQQESSALYVDEEANEANDKILPETPPNGTPSQFPLTTAQHVTHSTTSA